MRWGLTAATADKQHNDGKLKTDQAGMGAFGVRKRRGNFEEAGRS